MPCQCTNRPWVQRANVYLHNHPQNIEHCVTINFLLANHCGLQNATTIDEILNDLAAHNIVMNYTQFQQTILGDLKREGIVFVALYLQRSVFIPCDIREIQEVAGRILSRTIQELINLEGQLQNTAILAPVNALRIISEHVRNII